MTDRAIKWPGPEGTSGPTVLRTVVSRFSLGDSEEREVEEEKEEEGKLGSPRTKKRRRKESLRLGVAGPLQSSFAPEGVCYNREREG